MTSVDIARILEVRPGAWDEQRETVRKTVLEVVSSEMVAALGRAHPAAGDQRAEIAVASPVGREQHQLEPVIEPDFRADDELERRPLCSDVRAHGAGDGAFIGDSECGVAESLRALDQLFRVGGSPEKGEIGKTVQLGVVGQHFVQRGVRSKE